MSVAATASTIDTAVSELKAAANSCAYGLTDRRLKPLRIAMEQQRAAALFKSGLGAAAAGQAAAAALFGGPSIGSEAAALVASTSSPPADSSGAKARVKV